MMQGWTEKAAVMTLGRRCQEGERRIAHEILVVSDFRGRKTQEIDIFVFLGLSFNISFVSLGSTGVVGPR